MLSTSREYVSLMSGGPALPKCDILGIGVGGGPPVSRTKLAQRNRCRKVARGERVTDEGGEKRRKDEKGAMMGGRVAKRVKSTP